MLPEEDLGDGGLRMTEVDNVFNRRSMFLLSPLSLYLKGGNLLFNYLNTCYNFLGDGGFSPSSNSGYARTRPCNKKILNI